MSEAEISYKVHVPWMHVFEWQQVCSDVFSVKLEERCRGYEKLLLWKARQRKLPPGIECTLELVYVDLLDKNAFANITNAGSFGDREMQTMMSNAIMRFLTHLGALLGRKKSFQEVAASLNIPSWLVQLRHHTAHGQELPSLLLLRKGVNFCLEWLLLNYWKEANRPSQVNISHLHYSNSEINELFKAWDYLHLYNLQCCDISPQDDNVQKIVQVFGKSEMDPSEVWDILGRNLVHNISTMCLNDDINEVLTNFVLQCKTFIPSPQLVQMIKTTLTVPKDKNVVLKLAKGWKEVLTPLQENYSLLPSLIHQLIKRQVALGEKHSSQQIIVSHWINVLCCSILKSRTEYKKCGNSCPRSFVEIATFSPNKLTSIFLPSLLMVAEPKFTEHEMILIKQLISLYTKGINRKPQFHDRIYNLQELLLFGKFPKISSSLKENSVQEVSEFKRSKLHGSLNKWSLCPLGSLPWSKPTVPSLDIPECVKWIEDTVTDSKWIENNNVNSRDFAKHNKKRKLMAVNVGLKKKK